MRVWTRRHRLLSSHNFGLVFGRLVLLLATTSTMLSAIAFRL